jgi:hypothetical protein
MTEGNFCSPKLAKPKTRAFILVCYCHLIQSLNLDQLLDFFFPFMENGFMLVCRSFSEHVCAPQRHGGEKTSNVKMCVYVCVCLCVSVYLERERERARAAFLGIVPHFFETFLTRSSSTCVKRSRSFLLTRTRDQLVPNSFVASSSHTPHSHQSLHSLVSAVTRLVSRLDYLPQISLE